MKIAVLSGKGGTGKTTVSASLAYISKMLLIDTDVEEPNSHIFLKGQLLNETPVYTRYPKVDETKCNLCGKCGDFCKFNAIIPAKNRVIVFGEACHDCGGCEIVCSQNAISWENREIGKIIDNKTYFDTYNSYGRLNVGEMSGVKIIKEIYKAKKERDFIVDCPPGTACTTVAAVEVADYAIIVVEPSPFGLSDMRLVVQLLRDLNIPFGVVINKYEEEKNLISDYCKLAKIEILGTIPFDRKIAENYSKGEIIADVLPKYRANFENILKRVKEHGN